MLAEAERQTPVTVRELYERTYREMRAAGFTAVGEFHYLGLDTALAAADAAEEAGIALRVPPRRLRARRPRADAAALRHRLSRRGRALRARGIAVGLAPHSVRACPRDWLVELGRYAASESLLSTCTPTSSRGRSRSASPSTACGRSRSSPRRVPGDHTTIVHATHADGGELDLVRDSGATICACPTTEADLGDGFLPAVRVLHRGIPLCIGSDSNVRIDPLEELRELEGIARRQDGRRGAFDTDALWAIGGANGGRALGLDSWSDIEVDTDHRSLEGVATEHLRAALVASCGADVVVAPS